MRTSAMLEHECIRLGHGQTLSYAIYGSPIPRTTVFYMHGFPSSRFEGKLWHSVCAKHHIRLIAPDRPGMGASSMQPNRSILDWPADVLLLASNLKVSQFYILGVGGGAPYALACMKQIPAERLLGVSVISGMYPTKFGTAGMMVQTRMMLWAAPWMPGLATFLVDGAMGKAARNKDPRVFEGLMAQEMEHWRECDRKAVKDPQNWSAFITMTREAFDEGSEGVGWEAGLLGGDWGFELGQLCVKESPTPLVLWHGKDDINSPSALAEKASKSMPGCVLRLKDGEGHVSFIIRHANEVLEDLVGIVEPEGYVQVGLME